MKTETYYALRFKGDNAFVALDLPSGGYPSRVSTIKLAQLWNSKDEAENYARIFVHLLRQRTFYVTLTAED